MGPDDDIAEERLLRVIEGGQGKGSAVAEDPGRKSPRNPLSRLRNYFAHRWARPVGSRSRKDPLAETLVSLSRIMWIVLAGCGLYLAVDFATQEGIAPEQNMSAVSKTAGMDMDAVAEPVKIEMPINPESFYLDAIKDRSPFTGMREAPQRVEEARGPTPEEKLRKMSDGLAVVGINRGNIRDAIVEDTVQQRTFFVKEGDEIKDMIVKEIGYDSIVLSHEGAEVEIV